MVKPCFKFSQEGFIFFSPLVPANIQRLKYILTSERKQHSYIIIQSFTKIIVLLTINTKIININQTFQRSFSKSYHLKIKKCKKCYNHSTKCSQQSMFIF